MKHLAGSADITSNILAGIFATSLFTSLSPAMIYYDLFMLQADTHFQKEKYVAECIQMLLKLRKA